jgi:hypothetical protein
MYRHLRLLPAAIGEGEGSASGPGCFDPEVLHWIGSRGGLRVGADYVVKREVLPSRESNR